MADYSIKAGDNLWNIVKSNYNVSTSKEIRSFVNQIADENKDPNMIYAGASLFLPETDNFIKTTQETQSAQAVGEKTKADELQEWNSYDNMLKFSNNETIEEFEMFDAIGEGMTEQQYFDALSDFSQSVIDKYDADGDGVMNNEEFTMMATDELGIEEYSKQVSTKEVNFLASIMPDVFKADDQELIAAGAAQTAADMPASLTKTFADIQMDDDNESISAAEFAAQFFYADFNQETGKYDGSIDFTAYNSYTETSKEDKSVYYEYAKSFE